MAQSPSHLRFRRGTRWAYNAGAWCRQVILALTGLHAQRPRRRDATRRRQAAAGAPWRHRRRRASVTTPNSAMALQANRRAHAVLCFLRAWAQPHHHCASRQPASQPGRWAYAATAGAAGEGRWATPYPLPHWPCCSRCCRLVTPNGCGGPAPDSRRPRERRRVVPGKRRRSRGCPAPAPTQRDDAQGRRPGDGPGDGPPDGPVGRELDERVPPDGVRPVPGRQACMGEQPRHALGRGLLRAQAAGQLGLTARWLVQEGVHQVPAALALMALCPGQHSHARIVETGGRSVVRSPPPRLA